MWLDLEWRVGSKQKLNPSLSVLWGPARNKGDLFSASLLYLLCNKYTARCQTKKPVYLTSSSRQYDLQTIAFLITYIFTGGRGDSKMPVLVYLSSKYNQKQGPDIPKYCDSHNHLYYMAWESKWLNCAFCHSYSFISHLLSELKHVFNWHWYKLLLSYSYEGKRVFHPSI